MPLAPETKKEVWLALRPDGESGKGTPADPYDVSSASLFNERMKSFQAGTLIRLGPGIFHVPAVDATNTNEGATTNPDQLKWQPKPGQRIVGAGMFQTTLKIVGASNTLEMGSAVRNNPPVTEAYSPGSRFLDGFEISDLTIDCNMRGHAGKVVTLGAIALTGRRLRVRRVRVVDFGTEGGANRQVNGEINAVECFAISVANPSAAVHETVDCLVEDCLLEHPSPDSIYSNSCLILGGGETGSGEISYHRFCTVRRCLVDHRYHDRPAAVARITFIGTTAEVQTKRPHGRRVGDWIVVTGAMEWDEATEQRIESRHFNGTFQVTKVPDPSTLEYTLFETNPATTRYEPTGDIWIGLTSPQPVAIKRTVPVPDPDLYNKNQPGLAVEALGGSQWRVTLCTEQPHRRKPGNRVALNAILTSAGPISESVNRLFEVETVGNPARLTFVMSVDPALGQLDLPNSEPFINLASAIGVSPDAGVGAASESNRIYHVITGVYHDTYGTKDVTIRRDSFVAVRLGVRHSMQRGTKRSIVSIQPVAGPSNTVAEIVPAVANHTLEVGQAIFVVDAGAPYDGRFLISEVPRFGALRYNTGAVLSAPGSPGADKLTSLWQVRRFLLRSCSIDLVLRPAPFGSMTPRAIDFEMGDARPVYHFSQVILRNNFIRNVDSQANLFDAVGGIRMTAAENLIISGNVISLATGKPMTHRWSGSVGYFGNVTPAGTSLLGWEFDATNDALGAFVNELDADNALSELK